MIAQLAAQKASRKRPGWEGTLALWARSRAGQSFAWGSVDCAILCFEAFDKMTGLALASEYRGRYSTEAQAHRFQRRRANLLSVLERAGCLRAMDSRPGDVIVAPKNGFLCGHVCLGRYCLSAWPESGVWLCESAEAASLPGAVVLRIP